MTERAGKEVVEALARAGGGSAVIAVTDDGLSECSDLRRQDAELHADLPDTSGLEAYTEEEAAAIAAAIPELERLRHAIRDHNCSPAQP